MVEITDIINNVGFPILACIFMYKQQKELNGIIGELSLTLKGIDMRLQVLEKESKSTP